MSAEFEEDREPQEGDGANWPSEAWEQPEETEAVDAGQTADELQQGLAWDDMDGQDTNGPPTEELEEDFEGPPWRPQPADEAPPRDFGVELSRRPMGWSGSRKGQRLVKPDEVRLPFSPTERLLILDAWQRSGLPAGDFAPLVGLSKHTLYLWKKRFAQHGPAGLMERPRVASSGSKLPEVTKRTILMLKQLHPDCKRPANHGGGGPQGHLRMG